MRFFVSNKALEDLRVEAAQSWATEHSERETLREGLEADQRAQEALKAKQATARTTQAAQLQEMQAFKDVGTKFQYLGYSFIVQRIDVTYSRHYGGQLLAVCEYKHDSGDLKTKSFSYEEFMALGRPGEAPTT